jgi:hypothetical protein
VILVEVGELIVNENWSPHIPRSCKVKETCAIGVKLATNAADLIFGKNSVVFRFEFHYIFLQ